MADNNTLRKDLGPVTAYAIAVEAGFEGTQEEWVRRISSSVDQQSFATLAASVASGDATLSDKIDTDVGAEAAARSAADTAEAAARSAADTAEATARETADTAQSGRIDALSETVAGNDTTLRNILVHKPADSYSPDGTNGQVLMTHGDGTTEWSSFGQPTPEQAAAAVSAWLDAHPEATTTVVDGSITKAKLDSELKDRVNLATNSLAPIFQQATANDPGTYVSIADRLYYLPEGHAADVTWENTTKVEVQTTSEIKNLSDDVSGLKSAITNLNETVYEDIDISDFTWESGTYNATTGAANSTGNAIRLVNIIYALKGSTIRLNTSESGYSLRVLEMDSATETGENHVIVVANATSVVTTHDAYLRIVLIKSGINGDTTKASYVTFDLIGKSKISENTEEIAKADNNIETLYEISGYVKPNLISTPFTGATIDGVTYTVNPDWSVSVVGTNTKISGGSGIGALHVILPAGKYILTAFGADSAAGPFVRLTRSDDSYVDCNYDYSIRPFEITSETEDLRLYIRTGHGQTVDSILYPMIRSADVYDDTYAKYGEYAVYKPIQKLIDYTQFNWSGKKMNALGDSIVKGSNGNFINVIRGILNLETVRNYGIGGSCIASSSKDQEYTPAILRYNEMDNDAQIVLVHAGTNDYTAQVPIGDVDSTDITTWNGALNVLMNGLREKYPTALIIFSNILDRIQDNNPDRYPIVLQTYRDALEAACRRNHIVFYNGYEELGFDFHKGYYDHILTVDGLHPNQTGANIMGRSIAGFIKWH